MNRDIEAFPEQFLAWLLQSDHLKAKSRGQESLNEDFPSGDSLSSAELEDCDFENWEIDDFDLLESEVLNAALSSTIEPEVLQQPPRPADIPAVKERFQALLKRRLQKEIQSNPPLFPWETEISDYEPDRLSKIESESTFQRDLWTPQQEKIGLPVSIAPKVFAQLLERCQAVVLSSRNEKAKLVRALETLFPGHSQMLSKFADKILMPLPKKDTSEVSFFHQESRFPRSYEGATVAEQMVLLLLAAREILNALTLNLSANQLAVERQWQTTAGLLTLEAQYQTEKGSIGSVRIGGQFPCGGSLKLQVGQAQAATHRPDPGCLSVELFDLEPNQTYPLEIQFQQIGQKPLIFALLVNG